MEKLILDIIELIKVTKERNWDYKNGGYYRKGYLDALEDVQLVIEQRIKDKKSAVVADGAYKFLLDDEYPVLEDYIKIKGGK